MKFRSIIPMLSVAAAAMFGLSSCNWGDDNDYDKTIANAIVTVRTTEAGTMYLQVTEDGAYIPSNITSHPFDGKTVRAFTNIEEPTEDGKVYVNWIDSVLTKQPVADLGEDNAKTYGNDPVDIVNHWSTVAEDGFLTLRFRTAWSGHVKHEVNLVTGSDPDDPYKVIFYHNAHGDTYGMVKDGVVAFDLSSLPPTGDEPVELTLVWKSPMGEKSIKFDYRSHKDVIVEE